MNQSEQFLLQEITRLEVVAFNLQKKNELLQAELNILKSKGSEKDESTKQPKFDNKQKHD